MEQSSVHCCARVREGTVAVAYKQKQEESRRNQSNKDSGSKPLAQCKVVQLRCWKWEPTRSILPLSWAGVATLSPCSHSPPLPEALQGTAGKPRRTRAHVLFALEIPVAAFDASCRFKNFSMYMPQRNRARRALTTRLKHFPYLS